MFIPFDQISADARLWVYTSSRALSRAEAEQVENTLKEFISHWETHGKPLRASAQVVESQFVLLAVEEDFQQPSGCSIDASVKVLADLEQELNINLLEQGKVAFRHEDRIKVCRFPELKSVITAQELQAGSSVFNTLARQKADWESQKEQPAGQTWLSRYFS